MAAPGEIEVFRISPEVGKCYEHVEATRNVYVGGGNYRYFTTNVPTYVGQHIRKERQGYGDGGSSWEIFYDSRAAKEKRVGYSYAGLTCFREVPCPSAEERRGHAVASWLGSQMAEPAANLGAVASLRPVLTQEKRAGSRRRNYRKKPRKTRRKKCRCKN